MADIRIYDREQYSAACGFARRLRDKLDALKALRSDFINLEMFGNRRIHGCDLYASGPLEDVIDDCANLLERLTNEITRYAESDRDADKVSLPCDVEAA